VAGSPLSSRQIDGVLRALPGVTVRANRMVALLRSLGGVTGLADASRVNDAIADAFHRALFVTNRSVNVHDGPPGVGRLPAPPAPSVDPATELAGDPALKPRARQTRAGLIEAGHHVFAELGYYATRVADIIAEAGVSRGVFYRYFDNKTHLFRVVAERASIRLAAAFAEIPQLVGSDAVDDMPKALRSWLTAYAATSGEEAAITVMWSEAMSRVPELSAVTAAVTEWQRSACADILAPRGFGDVDADSLLIIMLLDDMTVPRPSASRIETTAQIIERAFLTSPTP
jgi:AcrR family transcriptional regulator